MKRLVSSIVLLTTLVAASPAWAQPTADESPGVVAPLEKSQPAPFSGVLFSPEAVAKIIAEKDAVSSVTKLAVQHQADIDAAQLKFQVDSLTTSCTADKTVLQAQVDDGKRQNAILNEQLKKANSGVSSPVLFGLGAAAGVVVSLLTVFVVGQATK